MQSSITFLIALDFLKEFESCLLEKLDEVSQGLEHDSSAIVLRRRLV